MQKMSQSSVTMHIRTKLHDDQEFRFRRIYYAYCLFIVITHCGGKSDAHLFLFAE